MILCLAVDVTGYTGNNAEILRHNFTLRVSTEAFESRILSSIYKLLTLARMYVHTLNYC